MVDVGCLPASDAGYVQMSVGRVGLVGQRRGPIRTRRARSRRRSETRNRRLPNTARVECRSRRSAAFPARPPPTPTKVTDIRP